MKNNKNLLKLDLMKIMFVNAKLLEQLQTLFWESF